MCKYLPLLFLLSMTQDICAEEESWSAWWNKQFSPQTSQSVMVQATPMVPLKTTTSASYAERLKSFFVRQWQGAKDSLYHGVEYIKHNKATAGAFGAGAVTAGLVSYVFGLQYRLQRTGLWSRWKSSICLKALDEHAERRYAIELLYDIQKKYLDVHHVTDFIGPIQQFMADLDAEINSLQQYKAIARCCHTVKLTFLINEGLVEDIEPRLEQLEALRELCLHWIVQSKLPEGKAAYAKGPA